MEPVSVSKLSGGGNDETGGSPWGRDQVTSFYVALSWVSMVSLE